MVSLLLLSVSHLYVMAADPEWFPQDVCQHILRSLSLLIAHRELIDRRGAKRPNVFQLIDPMKAPGIIAVHDLDLCFH